MLETGKLRPVGASAALPGGGLRRGSAALLLLAAALALFLFGDGGASQAQTTQTLVSNTAQASDSDVSYTTDHGQAFATGYNLTGYTVTGVKIISDDAEGDAIALQICEVDNRGAPTTTCTDLTAPATFPAGPLTFAVPDGTTLTLSSRTTYMVVFKSPGGEPVTVDATTSNDEDADSLPYWSIRYIFQLKNNENVWQDGRGNRAIRIAIEGTANAASATAPTAMDGTVVATEDTVYHFTAADFNFSATTNGDTLASVQILTLPALGTLRLANADGSAPVDANDSVTKAQLDAGNLLYTPRANANGTGYAGFLFRVSGSTEASTFPYSMTVDVTATDDRATGTPAVLGTAEVRRTLTASTADIADVDGLSGAFTYQWKRYAANGTTFEANIGTDATYTLTATEEGKKVLVEVSFMDVVGTSEGPLVSAAFPESGTVGASFLASNSEQGDDSSHDITVLLVGQAFTIGPDAPSYNVTAVTIFSEDPEGDDLTLQICDVNSNGHPSATCTDLTAPGNFAAGPLTFTPLSGTPLTLFSRTTYMAVLQSPDGEPVSVDATTSDDEDADSLPNWSIRNSSQFKDSTGWRDDLGGDSIRITIQGTANPASSTAPTAMDNTVATTEDMPYTFAAADFRFSATTTGDTLASVRIRPQPADGTLTLNGVDVTANQSVTKAQLDAGSLVYTPAAHGFGSGYARFQFRVGGGSEESSFAYWMTIDVTGENDPATGAPTISGTAEVGQTLTASITGIADPEGVPSAFTYQWISVEADGTSNATNIGANARTYTLTASEEGKKVQVEVSFVDNGGTSEGPLASAAYPASGTVLAAPVVNTPPTAMDSTVTASEDTDHAFAAANFSYTDTDNDDLASVKITGLPAAGTLRLNGTAIASGDLPKTVLAADLTAGKLKYRPPTNANGTGYASFTFKVNDGTSDSDEYTMTIDVTSVNDPAQGGSALEIVGPAQEGAQEGETLAVTSFFFDPNDGGIDNDSYTYQWKRFSADGTIFEDDIGTNETYMLTASEVGKKVKVAITFLDGDLNSETILSDAYPESGTVTAAPEAPTASDGAVTALEGTDYTFAAADFNYATDNANPLVSVKITGAPAEFEDELTLNGIQITGGSVPVTVTTNDLTAGKLKYTPPANANGTSFKFKVNDGTVDSNAEYTMTITVSGMNAPASGAPTIDGTAQVGQTLTVSTDNIADADGLPGTFAYQWKRYASDGTTFEANIGTDASTYTLSASEEGKKVQVEVSFVDNGGTSEGPLASAAYPASGTVVAAHVVNTPPTASDGTVTTNEDTDHTFAADDFGYADSEDNPLASVKITGLPTAGTGTLTLDGTVIADTDLPKTVAAADLTASKLKYSPPADANGTGYASFTFKVNDGTADSAAEYTMTIDVTSVNDPAEGSVSIVGPAQEGETLAATFYFSDPNDGGIYDDYTYQWKRFSADGTIFEDDIGEDSAEYMLTASEVGKTVKVAITFLDGDLNTETRLSALYPASGTVVAAPVVNTPPMASDGTVTTNEDTDHAFAAANFSYTDTDNDALASVKITGLPAAGELTLDGTAIADTDLPKTVAATDLTASKLKYSPPANANGTSYTSFTFKVNDGTADSAAEYTMTIDVTSVNDPAEGSLSIVGPAQEGETLAASFNFSDMNDGGIDNDSYTYQWKRFSADGTIFEDDIGEDSDEYPLTASEVGKTLKVAITFLDGDLNTETRLSALYPASGTVVAAPVVNTPPTASDGTVTTNEDTDHAFAAANFSYTDTEDNPLASVKITGLPAAGELTLDGTAIADTDLPKTVPEADLTASNSKLKYSPPADANGTGYASFTFKVNDGTADSAAEYTMTINVTAVNDPPTAAHGTVTTNEDTDHAFAEAHFSYTDTDNDALASVKITGLPAAGTGTLTLDGTAIPSADLPKTVPEADLTASKLKYSPPANANGTGYASFTFKVNDGTADSAAQYTMTIDVTPVNDPATGEPAISGTAQVGQTLTASTAGIADLDGLPGTFSYQWIRVDANGTSNPTNIGLDSSTYTLSASEEGKKVKVEVSFVDNGGTSEGPLASAAYPASGTVVAAPLVNTPPTASDGTVTTNEDTDHAFAEADFSYADSDSDALASVKITGLPAAGELTLDGTAIADTDLPKTVAAADLTPSKLNYSPPINANGTGYASFTFKVNDGTADSAAQYTMTIDVTSVNDPALSDVSIEGTAQEGQTLTTSVFLRDPNDGGIDDDSYTYQWKRFSADRTIFEADIGTNETYTLTASEVGKTVKVAITFLDGDLNTETILSAAYPATGTVAAAPEAPTASDGAVTALEGTDYTFAAADFNYATDNANPLVSVKITGAPAEFEDELTLNGIQITGPSVPVTVTTNDLTAGKLKYTPPANANGTSFKFKVNDGTVDSNAEYTMTITVSGMNAPASGAPTIDGTAQVGQTLTADTNHITDANGLPDSFQYQWKRYSANGTTFEADIGEDSDEYTLTSNEEGKKVQVEVSFVDNGGTSEGPLASAAYPASGTVVAAPVVNTPPMASDGTVTTNEDTDHAFAATDFSYADGEGDPLASVKITGLPAAGELTLDGTAIADTDLPKTVAAADLTASKLKYTPPANANGTGYASFTFKVNDGTADSAAQYTMTIDVTSVNDPPTASDGTVTTNEDTDHAFAAANFSYTDTDNDALASVKITGLPAAGTGTLTLDGTVIADTDLPKTVAAADLTASNSKLKYSPPANANGTSYTSFTFKVNDGTADSAAEYTMTINVTAVNDPATGAPAISGPAQVGQTLTASTAGIADLDGLPGTFSYQWIRVDANGTSNPTNIGLDSSTYTLSASEEGKKVKVEVSFVDNGGTSEGPLASAAYPASGTVLAAPVVNTPPTASDGTVTTNEDTDHAFAAANFSYTDTDNDALASVKITGLPAAGELTLDGTAIADTDLPKTVPEADLTASNSKLKYSPPADANGTGYASFTFKVNDGTADSAAQYTMTIDVTPVNDPATGAPAISGIAQVGQTLTVSTDNIADADGLPGTFAYQWIRVDANGTSNPTNIGLDSSTYTLSASEEGKKVKVEVSFMDNGGTSEGPLASALYPASGTVVQLTVQFEQEAYTVAEGGAQSVTVTLSADPERTVTIPITATDQGGADTYDYSVPSDVTFNAGDTSMTFHFSATQDMEDDDGESVLLGFDTNMLDRVSAGATAETTISITDDDGPGVNVSPLTLNVVQGRSATYTLVLATRPPGAVTVTPESDNAEVTFSPATLTFERADWDVAQTVTVEAAADSAGETATISHAVAGYPNVTAAPDVNVTVTEAPPISFGGGGGGGGGGGPSGPTPSEADFGWTVERDIEELDSGHDTPAGLWSDGATLWVLENGDGVDDAVYAYDLKTGERVEGREFKLDEANRAPRGVWSDGTALWVSDSGRNRLFAHDLATGERLPERDIAFADRNRDARGIWSGDETMWVLDGGKDSLFAYDLASGELLAEYEFASANGDPHGIWSDGVTVWVSNHDPKRLFAYRLPAPEGPAAEDAKPQALERVRDEEFTELSRASNNSPRGIWSDGAVMYVADESDDRVYTYNMPDDIDARLGSLTLSGVEIGEFDGGRTGYEGTLAANVTRTTVEAVSMQHRTTVVVAPPDADGNPNNGHQVDLAGLVAITVSVTSADGSRTRVYRVQLEAPGSVLELSPTWTSFEWPGADGTGIAEALGQAGIFDEVLAIYRWDEATSTWLAFFPSLGDVPGLNTLTTLEPGQTYWFAVTEPLTWTVSP